MPRTKSSHLTDAELRLMDIVWEKGAATVGEVVDAVNADTPLAYSTVLTTLRILENKGYLRHTKDGRAFVYRPVVRRNKAQESAIKHLLRRFFQDSPELLVLNLRRAPGRPRPARSPGCGGRSSAGCWCAPAPPRTGGTRCTGRAWYSLPCSFSFSRSTWRSSQASSANRPVGSAGTSIVGGISVVVGGAHRRFTLVACRGDVNAGRQGRWTT